MFTLHETCLMTLDDSYVRTQLVLIINESHEN